MHVMTPPRSLLLCTTPRSGSTLVCALLRASGAAGWPESWYLERYRAEWAADWGIADASGAYTPRAYLSAAIRAGTGAGGTFGMRIQGITLSPLLAELAPLFPGAASDRALLERAFGPCHFLYIHRRDDVAQAVSRLKAEVSEVWHLDGRENATPKAEAAYDADRLDAFRAEAASHNARWSAWFADQGITPETLVYEDFASAPAAHVRRLLDHLTLTPTAEIAAPNRRMADATSVAWSARYRAERGLPPTPPIAYPAP